MKTPQEYLDKFESLKDGLNYGDVILKCSIKMGKPRYLIGYEESFIPIDEIMPFTDGNQKPDISSQNEKRGRK